MRNVPRTVILISLDHKLDTESEIFNLYFDNEEAHQIFTKRGKIYFSVPGLTFMAQVTCDVERNI